MVSAFELEGSKFNMCGSGLLNLSENQPHVRFGKSSSRGAFVRGGIPPSPPLNNKGTLLTPFSCYSFLIRCYEKCKKVLLGYLDTLAP